MNYARAFVALIALGVLGASASASADETSEGAPGEAAPTPAPSRWRPENYIGANLMGFLGFLRIDVGSYELYYERIVDTHHGLQIAGDFIHVHEDAEHHSVHLWTFGGSLSYRYHFGPGVGPFAGINIGYRRGFGREHAEGHHTEVAIEQFRAMAQVGYRFFAAALGLTVVPRVGIGYGEYHVRATNRPGDAGRLSALTARDVLAPWGLIVELELSVGIGF